VGCQYVAQDLFLKTGHLLHELSISWLNRRFNRYSDVAARLIVTLTN